MSARQTSDPSQPFARLRVRRVINAAGKMTALGGSAQDADIAVAQSAAARVHVDLDELRRAAGSSIAALIGADAASVTTGAAAGIAIGVAAAITGTDLRKIARVPDTETMNNRVLLQAGHDVNFGAPVEQMIRLGGGKPELLGSRTAVLANDLTQALSNGPKPALLVYVQSHHCVQERRLPLAECVRLSHAAGVPVLVDAAAEEDLSAYIAAGADLVTYSGGKAIGGPTCGFIAGKAALIEACELQQRGIARAMKVGKEQIAGLIAALETYHRRDAKRRDALVLKTLCDALRAVPQADAFVRQDEAGRPIERVALRGDPAELARLVKHLESADPSIRTRNHQLKNGLVQLDPREMALEDVQCVVDSITAFYTPRDA